MPNKPPFLLSAAARLDIPSEALAGASRLTLTAPDRLLIENHRGLLNLEDERIIVASVRETITVRGSGLKLDCMNFREMLITGKIFSVELE